MIIRLKHFELLLELTYGQSHHQILFFADIVGMLRYYCWFPKNWWATAKKKCVKKFSKTAFAFVLIKFAGPILNACF